MKRRRFQPYPDTPHKSLGLALALCAPFLFVPMFCFFAGLPLHRHFSGVAAAAAQTAAAGAAGDAGPQDERSDAGDSSSSEQRLEEDLSIEELAFRAILSDDELREYTAVPLERRDDWRRRFWKRSDSDPTTARNERLEEHGARLARARELFGAGGRLKWDDRCSAMVRFGEPLVRVEDGGEVVLRKGLDPPRERWLYKDRFLYMEDRNLNGEFKIGISSLASGIGRADNIGADEDQFIRGQPSEKGNRIYDFEGRPEVEFHFPDFSEYKLQQMLIKGRQDWVKEPRAYESERTGTEIPFVFDVSTFRGTGGKSDVIVTYLIPFEHLTQDDDGVWVERRTVVIDEAQNVAGNDIEALEQPRSDGDLSTQWILNSATLPVPPGKYQVASRVTDLVSQTRQMGLMRTDTTVPDYGGAALAMSDILFGASVEMVKQGDVPLGGIVRKGWRIIPTPVRRFNRLTKPHLYFEVYNLQPGDDGRYKYRVEYVLTKQEPRGFLASIKGLFSGNLRPGVATAFDRETKTPDSDNWIAIDTEDLPADTYYIETRVTDLVSGQETSRRESFVIAGGVG